MVKGRNEPIAIARVAHVIASVKGITVEEVCEAYAVTGFWCLVLPANIFVIVLGITRSACLDWVRSPLDRCSWTSCYRLDISTFTSIYYVQDFILSFLYFAPCHLLLTLIPADFLLACSLPFYFLHKSHHLPLLPLLFHFTSTLLPSLPSGFRGRVLIPHHLSVE